MRTKTILALVGLLALGFAVQGGNLVPEGKRDFDVPFKGAGQMSIVYTPVFFPKGTAGVVMSGEAKRRSGVMSCAAKRTGSTRA